MSDAIKMSEVDAILALSLAKDKQGHEFVFVTVRLKNGNSIRLPMSSDVAMQMWGLLDKLRLDKAWPMPKERIVSRANS